MAKPRCGAGSSLKPRHRRHSPRHHQAESSLPSMLRMCSRLQRSQIQTCLPFSNPSTQVRRAADSSSGIRARTSRRPAVLSPYPSAQSPPNTQFRTLCSNSGHAVDGTFHLTACPAAVARDSDGALCCPECISFGNGALPGFADPRRVQCAYGSLRQRIGKTLPGDFNHRLVTGGPLRRHLLYRLSRAG